MKTSDQQLGVSPGLIRRTNATPVGRVAVPASGPRYWKSVWSSRHTVAAVMAFLVLALALFSVRSTALAGQLPSAFDLLLLAPAAALGAVTLATYVPPAGVSISPEDPAPSSRSRSSSDRHSWWPSRLGRPTRWCCCWSSWWRRPANGSPITRPAEHPRPRTNPNKPVRTPPIRTTPSEPTHTNHRQESPCPPLN